LKYADYWGDQNPYFLPLNFFMKRLLFLPGMILLLLTACKKSDSDNTSTATVTYQVTATNSSGIAISYNNVLENKIAVNAQNSWTFDVIISQKPFHAYLQAISTSPTSSVQTTCTVNILVNGSVVKTASNTSSAAATAEAEFTVQ
jgi:hypothetical protein